MPGKADARLIALDVLDGTLAKEPRPAEQIFDQHPDLPQLSQRDRAFARLLYASCLRRLRALDAALDSHLRRPPKELRWRNILRLGAAQLLLLATPPHAAIKETVDLAKQQAPGSSGLVNAVLRKLVGATLPTVQETPAWMLASWRQAYGETTAEAIAQAHLQEAPLDLTCPVDTELWAGRLGAQRLGASTLRLAAHGPVAALDGYDDGAFWVQDVAAAAIVPLLGDVAGLRVLDLCAAPGGKTAQLCRAGAQVTAVEINPRRAQTLRANMRRLHAEPEVVVADATSWRPPAAPDAILLDAPCAATGTIRRHPDILRSRRPADLERMATVQARLLGAAIGHLAPGGVLVYAVCSLQPEEGPAQIDRLLAARDDIEPAAIDPSMLHGLPFHHEGIGRVRSLPSDLGDLGGMDGFFAARLRRRANH